MLRMDGQAKIICRPVETAEGDEQRDMVPFTEFVGGKDVFVIDHDVVKARLHEGRYAWPVQYIMLQGVHGFRAAVRRNAAGPEEAFRILFQQIDKGVVFITAGIPADGYHAGNLPRAIHFRKKLFHGCRFHGFRHIHAEIPVKTGNGKRIVGPGVKHAVFVEIGQEGRTHAYIYNFHQELLKLRAGRGLAAP